MGCEPTQFCFYLVLILVGALIQKQIHNIWNIYIYIYIYDTSYSYLIFIIEIIVN